MFINHFEYIFSLFFSFSLLYMQTPKNTSGIDLARVDGSGGAGHIRMFISIRKGYEWMVRLERKEEILLIVNTFHSPNIFLF